MLSVLYQNPNFLVLDEPTNDLDLLTLQVLEEFLQNFQGCVVIVSHDRYFLDKLVDHLLVFEGNAVISDFPGTYTEYRNFLKATKKDEDDETVVVAESKTESKPKQQISFKDKRELEQLEKELEKFEKEKHNLHATLSRTDISLDDLTAASVRLGVVMKALDEKGMQWLELSEKVSA